MKKLLIISTFVLALFAINSSQTFATTIEGPAPHFVNEDNVKINDEVNGDTFLVGQNVVISKPINGDLYVIAENVVIDAPINGDLKVAATNVEIKSQVSGSFAFIADKVLITPLGEISKDAYGLASEFNLYGRVGGDLNMGYADEANILVEGNVAGNIHYLNSIPNITSKAFLGGKLVKTNPNDYQVKEENRRFSEIIQKIVHSLSLIFIVMLALRFIPKKFGSAFGLYKSNFGKNILFGLLALFAFPLIIILLAVSLIGLPIALLSTALLFFALYIAPIYPAMWIGQKLLPNSKSILMQAICGIFIFDVVSMGPVIGSLILTFSIITFLGLVLKILLGLRSTKISKQ
jgi:hypothetical protein